MAAFTPWTAHGVTAQIIQTTQAENVGLTDFTIGSVLRSGIAEPIAISAQDLAEQIVAASDQNMQVTLQKALNLTPQSAVAAYGEVTFAVPVAPTSSVTLPSGFTVAIPNSTIQYTLGATTIWSAGTTSLNAVVTCNQSGSVGNAPANTITQIVSAIPSGLSGLTVTNPLAFTTGSNAQTPLEATAEVPAALAALKAATTDAIAAKALGATVQNSSGYVVEAVGAAVSTSGGYVTSPSAAPVLTAVSPTTATNLAAGTYTVGYTWTTAAGETPLSPTATVTLTAGQAIQVGALTLPNVGQTPPSPNATGINYYLSTAAGSSSVAYDANGTGAETTLTALPASGAASPPTVNTAFSVTPGYATCWIANDLQTAPSATLISHAQQSVDGYTDTNGNAVPGAKAAGIVTTVVAAQLQTQNFAVSILTQPGYTLAMVQDSVTQAITDYMDGLDIYNGQNANAASINANAIILAITSIPGVGDCQLTTPSGNVAGILGTQFIVGTITVSQMS
ncbi:baseplate J/gp47 family protein [Sulfobacillus harzensis]|uniref:Baseplate protein J-like domain-containing protein n=1 Tax=Sulfobacillus harzensis TaxID=2729629 RepID=A0A7Y0L2P9_9FIRM|nr:baseplate J/gp47 family protein [Sulfobacillus harzensis]NMP20784.1 hypothetical protein [Sulfobacillus harzensis]